MRARLLDVVPGRSGTACRSWLKAQTEGFTARVAHAALDPFRGYANAIRDELPDAVAVLDALYADVLVMPMWLGFSLLRIHMGCYEVGMILGGD